MAASPASSLAVLGASSLAPYWRFQRSVAKAQLAYWLPSTGKLLIDISGPASHGAVLAAARGHTVVRVLPAHPTRPGPAPAPRVSGHRPAATRFPDDRGSAQATSERATEHSVSAHATSRRAPDDSVSGRATSRRAPEYSVSGPASRRRSLDYRASGQDGAHPPTPENRLSGLDTAASGRQPRDAVRPMAPSPLPSDLDTPAIRADADGQGRLTDRAGARAGRIVPVVAEPGSLAFLADACADGVIAEDGALSRHLMSEDLAAEITRVLRPGGELLACVDSLVLGMAILAEQHHWAHLTDLPHCEVVLIPWPDGTITRCFGSGQLQDLLTEAGLEVNWITPRTVLSPSIVDHVLRQEPSAMARLVRAELRAERDRRPAGTGSDESFGINLLAAARKPSAGRGGAPGHRRMTRITKRGRRRTAVRGAVGTATQPEMLLSRGKRIRVSTAHTVPLGLANDATGGLGPRIQPSLGDR
ncbi:MAG TPA: hypothetical protein VIV12_17245 [Streptosporangiaceae bacterium]